LSSLYAEKRKLVPVIDIGTFRLLVERAEPVRGAKIFFKRSASSLLLLCIGLVR
jgi:hypothetical protein